MEGGEGWRSGWRKRDEVGNFDHHDIFFCFQGDLYAVPNRKAHMGKKRVKGGRSHQNSDIEDFMSETMSHQSYNAGNHGHHFRGYVAMWLFQPHAGHI